MKETQVEVVAGDEKRDARGRRIISAGRRAELLDAYERSGMTQAQFARSERITYPTFATWVQKWRRGKTASDPAGMAPVRAPLAKVRFQEVRALGATMKPPQLGASESMRPAVLHARFADGLELSGSDTMAMAGLIKALRR